MKRQSRRLRPAQVASIILLTLLLLGLVRTVAGWRVAHPVAAPTAALVTTAAWAGAAVGVPSGGPSRMPGGGE